MIRSIIFLLTVTLVAVASCFLFFYVFLRREMPITQLHESFIEKLELDDALRTKISTIDEGYDNQREEIIVRFRAATEQLSKLLSSEDAYNGEVTQAINAVHAVHGELQSLSVQRYFSILAVLPNEKRPQFRQLAADALSHPE